LVDKARAGGVPLAIVPALRREIHPWRDTASYLRLKRLLREFRPDVVHTHSGKAGLLGRMAATSVGVPAIVHTVHGAPFHPYQNGVARALFRRCELFAAARCDALISVADAMTDLLVNAGVAPREKFTTIYSGMEVEPLLHSGEHRGAVRRALGYADEHVVVGKIARLFHLKGHEYVIAAARQVVAADPRVRFLFVGNGILTTRLQQQVRDAGLEEQFQFAGLVGPERIPGLVAATDMVVHASLREGLARVLPQALLAGKPVISYDIDGAREVVISDATGFLLPPKSVDEMAAAILKLAGDSALRERLGAAGRERCAADFCHQHMTRRVREVYEKILLQRRG
jgi:glycosyltransferase involved in cell wall biosynthesis